MCRWVLQVCGYVQVGMYRYVWVCAGVGVQICAGGYVQVCEGRYVQVWGCMYRYMKVCVRGVGKYGLGGMLACTDTCGVQRLTNG